MILLLLFPNVFGKNCFDLDGSGYNGRKSTTKTGKTCQRWDLNSPHVPKYGKTLSHNYCRNPDGDRKGPWCYTIWVIKCFVPENDRILPRENKIDFEKKIFFHGTGDNIRRRIRNSRCQVPKMKISRDI